MDNTTELATFLYKNFMRQLEETGSLRSVVQSEMLLPINSIYDIDVDVKLIFVKNRDKESTIIKLSIDTDWIECIDECDILDDNSEDYIQPRTMLNTILFNDIISIELIAISLNKVKEELKYIEYNKTRNLFIHIYSEDKPIECRQTEELQLVTNWFNDFECPYINTRKSLDICPVCHEKTNTMLTNCEHSLCLECGSKIAKQNKTRHIRCPICREGEQRCFTIRSSQYY